MAILQAFQDELEAKAARYKEVGEELGIDVAAELRAASEGREHGRHQAVDDAGGITALPIEGELVAVEVVGLDPAAHGNDAAVAAWLRELLWQHGVLCIRLQAKLDDDEMRAVVQMFGPIKDPVGRDEDGNPVRYSDERQIIDAGFVLTDELREVARRRDVWAATTSVRDCSSTSTPMTRTSSARRTSTVLHARALPSGGGGDTCFIDMRAAYDLLDADMQARLVGLYAEHAYNNHDAFAPRPSATGDLERLVRRRRIRSCAHIR